MMINNTNPYTGNNTNNPNNPNGEPIDKTSKYLFKNNVMTLNPNYLDPDKPTPPPTAHDTNSTLNSEVNTKPKLSPLAIVSSPADIVKATADMQAARIARDSLPLSDATVESMKILLDKDYINGFGTTLTGKDALLLDNLGKVFSKYEVPIGLVNKLLAVSQYNLHFIIDDSASMMNNSDIELADACDIIKNRFPNEKRKLTRLEEVENRLHIFIDLLKHLPTAPITLSFLNKPDSINGPLKLEHAGKTPEAFGAYAHQFIEGIFKNLELDRTPLFTKLNQTYREIANAYETELRGGRTPRKTICYVLTDGAPTDSSIERVRDLVIDRPNPEIYPTTFISCTNNPKEVEWLKKLDEKAPFVAEIDNYSKEMEEVGKKQGGTFPFNYGLWLICNLAAAISPEDLDALDESLLSRATLSNVLGYKVNDAEYEYYFKHHPLSQRYAHLYHAFATEDVSAQVILKRQSIQPMQFAPPMEANMYSSPYQGYQQGYDRRDNFQNSQNQQAFFNQNPPQVMQQPSITQPYPGSRSYVQQYGMFASSQQQNNAANQYNTVPPQYNNPYNNTGYQKH